MRQNKDRKEVAMRKLLTMLAIAALLGAPGLAAADTIMPSNDEVQAGMMKENSQGTAEEKNGDTIKAEIVEIIGERVITETENGDQLVFHVEDSSVDFNVGDELELMVDDQAKTGVILNVFPKEENRKS
jgi:outer membrane protein assembly factor BamE (lipoprotein component of BamABCDE complex)